MQNIIKGVTKPQKGWIKIKNKYQRKGTFSLAK